MISPPRAIPHACSSARTEGHDAAGRLDNFLERLLHVFGLQNLVLAPFEMEAQHGNAPLIDGIGIDFAVAVLVRDHFAAARKVDIATVDFSQILLQFHAVAAAQHSLVSH